MKLEPIKEQFIEARAQGMSLRKCAAKFGVNRSTAVTWTKKLQPEIDQRRRERAEDIAGEYAMARADRLQVLGQLRDKLAAAIESADFSKVPGDRLVKMQLDVLDHIRQEQAPAGSAPTLDAEGFTAAWSRVLYEMQSGEAAPERIAQEVAILRGLGDAQKAAGITDDPGVIFVDDITPRVPGGANKGESEEKPE